MCRPVPASVKARDTPTAERVRQVRQAERRGVVHDVLPRRGRIPGLEHQLGRCSRRGRREHLERAGWVARVEVVAAHRLREQVDAQPASTRAPVGSVGCGTVWS